MSIINNRASATWEQLCQSYFETVVPVSLGKNGASMTWEAIVPVPPGNNCASLS